VSPAPHQTRLESVPAAEKKPEAKSCARACFSLAHFHHLIHFPKKGPFTAVSLFGFSTPAGL